MGALLLGFLMRYLLGTGLAGPEARAGLTIGFCGAFTTMSTFSYETVALLSDGEYWRATLDLVASVGGSLAGIAAGMGPANRLSLDLPIVIEVVETEEAIQAILPELDPMIGGGLITLERAKVIMYRPANVRPSQAEMRRIEGLEPED